MNISQTDTSHSRNILEQGKQSLIHDPLGGDEAKITLVRAKGSYVWDDQGRQYLDCTSQAWSNNLGANDPRVVEAAIAQLREITHARPNFNTIPLLKLTAKLREISPGDLNRIGYCLHGSLAVEMAMKLAFKNKPGRHNIIVLQDAYHGRSLTTMAASWPHPNNPFLPIQPRFTRVPHPDPYRPRLGMDVEMESKLCLRLLEETIHKGVDGGVVAIMMEPIPGNGGHIDLPLSFLRGVRDICDRNDIILIWDEIQSCFGRTGAMFAADYFGIVPDIMTFGKGISGGFPLAGILASERLTGFESGEDALTFGQFPVAMAAAVATIDAIIADDLCGKARDHGAFATQRLHEMADRRKLIGDIRGPGLFVSLELVKDRVSKEPATKAASEVYRRGLEKGVLFGESRYAGLGNLIKVKPPLDCTHEDMSHALDVLDDVLGSIEADGIA
ncbi:MULTISPECIES: aspartate aminotransferase family protein [Mesorhizobium]|uniref:4-aminobutyrate aminotransferase/4-aminobutyrate aminotransferase/(S)-3-amino-2-methylpropionate transaminase n=1 Tax=Rhizobium loti TaxID=381 RepID=A0A8E3B6Z9_RHILI|nr:MULTISPECIES: aspartate aminotransferase family protein [Mesorhizobium]PWJ94461.1 4-aminobutyrate aminotransferase/4-aminobutyrate aminotransferase/(S)-3-amino-2-methylpropionate transaminase [Mesorhizobium loti]RUX94620.1 aspartate aminotransferase family protein [Mesorhizobium sp. M7D.F.Ca.US.004.01.2.1]RVA36121.1 aspartate aminotransferase family protein [Mesorhizobium sp. M7D.F.Ca.US.004.03.1.1]